MKLFIGGYAQGKLDYVLKKYSRENCEVWDGEIPVKPESEKKILIVNHFHNWVKKRLTEGGEVEQEILSFVEKYPDCVIISDEIGNGIVPMDAFERAYREQTGRILIELAKRAEEVERIVCGLEQKIK